MKDVLKEARNMLANSDLIKKLASHICYLEEIEVQCMTKTEQQWETVDKGKRQDYENKEFDALKKENFVKRRYRFLLAGCGPLGDVEHLFKEESTPDKVLVYVKLFADKAEIKVQFVMSSRDVGYEETPVLSCMHAVTTGTWLEDHNVFPKVPQFETGLEKCLKMMGLQSWMHHADEEDESEATNVCSTKHIQKCDQTQECGTKQKYEQTQDSNDAEKVPKRSRSRSRDAKEKRSRSMSPENWTKDDVGRRYSRRLTFPTKE